MLTKYKEVIALTNPEESLYNLEHLVYLLESTVKQSRQLPASSAFLSQKVSSMEDVAAQNGLADEVTHKVSFGKLFVSLALASEGKPQEAIAMAEQVTRHVIESVGNDKLHPVTEKFYRALSSIYV